MREYPTWKVLPSGLWYLYFNARRNYERPQAIAFLHNCFDYLSRPQEKPARTFYWPKPEKGIREENDFSALKLPPVQARNQGIKMVPVPNA